MRPPGAFSLARTVARGTNASELPSASSQNVAPIPIPGQFLVVVDVRFAALLAEVAELASRQAAPISDLRASDTYRRHCVGVMARRAVDAATRRARGESIAVPVNRSLGIGAAS